MSDLTLKKLLDRGWQSGEGARPSNAVAPLSSEVIGRQMVRLTTGKSRGQISLEDLARILQLPLSSKLSTNTLASVVTAAARKKIEVCHRTLQRQAERRKIPGAFRRNTGCHFRIRLGRMFFEHLGSRLLAEYRRQAEEDAEQLVEHLAKVKNVVQTVTHSGEQGYKPAVVVRKRGTKSKIVTLPPHTLWTTPVGRIPHNIQSQVMKEDPKWLEAAAAIEDLQAKGEKITVQAVCKRIGMPRATFCRRDYHIRMKEFVKAISYSLRTADDMKDDRAKEIRPKDLLQ